MPHITIEATLALAEAIDFVPLFAAIHERLAAEGHGLRDDFKSRMLVARQHLAGVDRHAEFVVARLITTVPRPKTVQRDMARIIHDLLTEAIRSSAPACWWQCCVLNEPFEADDYFKTNSARLTPVG